MARLGDICIQITDGSHNPPMGVEQSNYLMLSSKNIDDDHITFNDPRYLSQEDFEAENKRTNIKPNDLLITIVGTIGRVAIVPNSLTEFCVQRSVAVLKPKPEMVYNRFLMYYLQNMRPYLEQESRGVAQKGIYLKQLSNLSIILPPLDEQRKIAAVLDKVSDLIAKRRQQLDKLDELVKARFVEMFGDLADPACKHIRCKLGETCKDSDDIKCGPFGTQLSKTEYQEQGVAVWEIPQINREFKEQPIHFVTNEKAKQLISYSLIPGDIAMSRKGNVGRCALFPKDFAPGIIHSDVLRIRVDKNKVNPCFLMYQLHFSKAVAHQIEMVSSGAVMAGINVTKLKQIYVHIPAFGLQNQFAAFVEQTEKTKTTISESLEKLETLKKALMQEYFG